MLSSTRDDLHPFSLSPPSAFFVLHLSNKVFVAFFLLSLLAVGIDDIHIDPFLEWRLVELGRKRHGDICTFSEGLGLNS